MRFRRRAVGGAVGVLTALALWSSAACAPPPAAEGEFTLVADSLGEVPLHPDAVASDALAKACDGSMATRWATVANMEPGFFVELKFPRPRKVAGLVLHAEPSPNDFPRGFVVEVSRDGSEWEEAAAGGAEATTNGVTTITFDKPRDVRHVLVTVNKAAPYWWSIYEMEVKYAER